MKVYFAAQYALKDILKTRVEELTDRGIEVTSSWLDEPHSPTVKLDDVSATHLRHYAVMDLDDIYRADKMIFFSEDPNKGVVRGGRHVEFGYALALGKPILVVGPKENIFHYLPEIQFVKDWGEALDQLDREAHLAI